MSSSTSWEIDATAIVTRVIDGDTFDASPIGRVRLADIDAPERGDLGSQEATDFLTSLVFNKTVYLDIDDVYGTDVYDRWICVVYVQTDAMHALNLNKALLDTGLADLADYDNEFSLFSWSATVPYPPTAPPPTTGLPVTSGLPVDTVWPAILAFVVSVGFAFAYAVVRRVKKRRPRRRG